MPIMKNHTVLDLFCGCGGLSLGFIQAGYDVLLGVDVWKDALVTYQRNHKDSKTLQADLINLQGDDIVRYIFKIFIIFAVDLHLKYGIRPINC